jgi:hypothetical protein
MQIAGVGLSGHAPRFCEERRALRVASVASGVAAWPPTTISAPADGLLDLLPRAPGGQRAARELHAPPGELALRSATPSPACPSARRWRTPGRAILLQDSGELADDLVGGRVVGLPPVAEPPGDGRKNTTNFSDSPRGGGSARKRYGHYGAKHPVERFDGLVTYTSLSSMIPAPWITPSSRP